MSAQYEEVVKLVVDLSEFNVKLNEAKSMFARNRSEMEQMGKIELFVPNKDWAVNLDKAYANVIKNMESRKQELVKINKEISEQMFKDDTAINQASVSKQINDIVSAKKNIVAINKEVREQMAQEEVAINQVSIDKQLQSFKTALREEEQLQIAFNKSMYSSATPYGPKEKSQHTPVEAPSVGAGMPLATLGRIGAGALVGMGQYNLAGIAYAMSNVANTAGLTLTATTALAGGLAALPIAGAGILVYGKELNEELAKMSTLMLDADVSSAKFDATLQSVTKSAALISSKFNMDIVEVVKGFKEAFSSGIEAEDIERFGMKSAELSKALNVSFTESANILTSFKDAYKLNVGEMGRINDILFNTVNIGKVNVSDLVTNFGRLLPVGKAAGISIEDLAAAVSFLTRQGMTASQSITATIQGIEGLTNASGKHKKALEDAGIATGELAFQGKSLLEVVTQIGNATGGSATAIGEMFGNERARRFFDSISVGTDRLKEFRAEMDKTGTATVAADRSMGDLWDHLGQQWEAFKNKFKTEGASLANILDKAIFGTADQRKADNDIRQKEVDSYLSWIRSRLAEGYTDLAKLRKEAEEKFIPQFKVNATGGMDFGALSQQPNREKIAGELDEAFRNLNDKTRDSVDKALKNTSDYLDGVQQKINNTVKSLGDVGKDEPELKSVHREIEDRQTDAQKQRIDDIKEEIDLQEQLIQKEQRRIQVEMEAEVNHHRAETIQPLSDMLDKKNKEGAPLFELESLKKQLDAAQSEFTKWVDELTKKYAENSPLSAFAGDVKAAKAELEDLYKTIQGQDTRKDREEMARQAKEINSELLKSAKELLEFDKGIYREDLAEYKKLQNERKHAVEQANKDIEREQNRSAQLQAAIMQQILDSKMKQNAGDPGAQVRTGRAAAEEDLTEIKDASAMGRISPSQFTTMVDKYMKVLEAIRNAQSQLDPDRAERQFQAQLEELQSLSNDYDRQYGKNKRNDVDNMKVPSQTKLMQDRKNIEADKKLVQNIELNAKIKLQVDGTLSTSTKKDLSDDITANVMKALDQFKKNQNRTSNYDRPTRGSYSGASSNNNDDNTSNYDDGNDE